MRKLSASFILGPDGNLLENHTLVMLNGIVAGLVNEVMPDAENFKGILSPGFINTHCHLELSHLKNHITPHTGLHGFIGEFVEARKTYTHGITETAKEADSEMWNNGIQGVGDICNVNLTFPIKKNSNIRYHNFVELFNMNPEMADYTFNHGVNLCDESESDEIRASIVPHAPYSVPEILFRLVQEQHTQVNSFWSIHNQETKSENEMFISRDGALLNTFLKMGIDLSWFVKTGKNSIESISEYFPGESNLLFIHNTFTTQDDIDFLNSAGVLQRTWFGLCPKANLFIENKLPDVPLFINNKCKISIGTDSLASNDTLSVLEELKAIHKNYPQIEIATLLQWATINGAEYFGWEDLGAFQKGNIPGVILISESDPKSIGANAGVTRII